MGRQSNGGERERTTRPATSGVRRVFEAAALAAVLAQAAGCGQGNVYREPPPPEVTVAPPVRRAVTSYLEYTGTTQAVEKVELRARVKGFLKEKRFKEGTDVEAGQLLLVIDEEPFRAQLEQAQAKQAEAAAALRKAEESRSREVAKAQLELDRAQLELAKLDESRNRALFSRSAGSREEVEKAEATRRKAEAQVDSDRANLAQVEADYEINILSAKSGVLAARAEARGAELDLGYCRIAAPISGRISRSEVDVGNYVGDGQATVLATIIKLDPIRAYVTIAEDDLLRVERRVREGKRADHRKESAPMEMGLGDEEGYPHLGRFDYIDPAVDAGTGTVRARGTFPNPGGLIAPGLFVRIRLPFERRENALLVPERALGADQAGTYLLVVGAGDKVERRAVRAGAGLGPLREVDGQIGPDDRVVVDGLLRARPGLKVQPQPEEPAARAVASAAGPGAG